jgi:hypothetical protein
MHNQIKYCQQAFECTPLQIESCQCYGIFLSEVARQYIQEQYNNCLCKSCLIHIQNSTQQQDTLKTDTTL